MTHAQHHEEGLGVLILGGLFRAIGIMIHFFLVVAPLVTLTVVGFLIVNNNQGNTVGEIAVVIVVSMLIVVMWVKGGRWQWNRILANRLKKKIQKLYLLKNIEVQAFVKRLGPSRYQADLYTPRGYSDDDVLNHLPEVSSDLRAVNVTSVEDDDPRDGHVRIFVLMNDVLADVPAPTDPPAWESIKEPLTVGKSMYGADFQLRLWQEHMIIGGMSGRGKSVLANYIIHLLQDLRGDNTVEVWGIDPHRTEFTPSDFDRLARSPEEASDMLTELLDEGQRRMSIMEENGWKKWDLSAGPAIVVLIDELAAILSTGDKSDKGRLRDLTRVYAEVRKAGISVVGMTQTPSAQLLGDIRNNAGIRVAFGCATNYQLGQILGDHWVDPKTKVTVSAIPAPTSGRDTRGMCFVVGGEYPKPTLGRVFAPND